MFLSGIADEAGQPLDMQLKAHRELGWKHIEVRNVDGVNLVDVSDEEFESILGSITEAGMKISCFAGQIANWARKITSDFEVDVAELKRAIPRMKKAATPFIRIMSYPNDGLSREDWKQETVRRIRILATMAEEGGVILAHENCSGYGGQSPEACLELLEAVDSPALKIVFDTGNPVSHGQESFEFYRTVREYISYVHIKDAVHDVQEDKVTFTYPGEGEGKVREIIKDLLESGYDGGFSIEPHMAAVVHEAKLADDPQRGYDIYVEYGRRAQRLIESLRG